MTETMIVTSLDVTELIEFKSELDPKRFAKALQKATHIMAQTSLKEYQSTVSTWTHSVEFAITENVDVNAATAEYMISTDDLIYHWVDKGTKPHIIRAKQTRDAKGHFGKRGKLRFMVGGSPKTIPGKLGSGPGAPGSSWVSKTEVHHPGTKARGFGDLIYQHIEKSYAKIAMKEITAEWIKQTKKSK